MRPMFQIIADDQDVTDRIAARLISLSVIDVAGGEADTCTMQIDDTDGVLEVPQHQAVLRVSLGMRDTGLVELGRFLVDSTRLSGPPQTMQISASAADMSGAIRSPRTASWDGKTLGDMAAEVAGRAGLRAVVAPRLAAMDLPFIAQTAESDLHLLTRLADTYHFRFAPKSGRLILSERGSDTLPNGDPTPTVTLDETDLMSWGFEFADRDQYKSVEASWANLGSAQIQKVVVGQGDPKRVIRHVHVSEVEARRAATALVQSAGTSVARATAQIAGFGKDLFAGARVVFTGLRDDVAGPWNVTRVTHRLQTSLTTEITLEAVPK